MTIEQLDAFIRLAALWFVFIAPILAVSMWIERRVQKRWQARMDQRKREAVMKYVKEWKERSGE